MARIYDGTCSECNTLGRVCNDPAGYGVPFCRSCYYETFEAPIEVVRV